MATKPKYTNPEDMQEKIEEYFESCKGHYFTDNDGNYVRDKLGYPIVLDAKPLTVTGLALALGFTNRGALLKYQAKPAFKAIIETAKLRVENYAEMRLYDKDGVNGAKFTLAANFGWNAEKLSQAENKAPAINIICDIPRENVSVETTSGTEGGQDG